jgi:hypothetical protein
LNSAGQPVVWEVLTDSSGTEVFFVAQSLETAARAEFGPPLPGRRYAIETSTNSAPNAVVARVIDDGPMPMGPMVYLQAGTRDVSTVICRCMAAQAKKLAGASTYELEPLLLSSAASLPSRAREQSHVRTSFWLGALSSDHRLENCLRLPARF